MASDGVKTNHRKRARTQRNKIVAALTGAATAAAGAEAALPGVVPPGSGVATGQVLTFLALLVNQFWPK